MSTTEQNREIVRRIQEAYDSGNLDALDALVASDIKSADELPGGPGGLAGAKGAHQMVLSWFPDYKVEIDEILAEGDRAIARFTVSGTHKGEMMGVPPTGKHYSVPGFSEYRIENGKAVEHWGLHDNYGVMVQLGLIPAPGA
ncbi:MAG: ester cyclase [Actinomycetota bacterium]